MSTTIFQQDGWTLTVFSGWERQFASIPRVRALLESPGTMLQENSRGSVGVVHDNGQAFVVKRSKRQERNFWIQLTSLYRRGEATRTLRNLERLCEAGLPVPPPVLVLEHQRFGRVVASWGVYGYLEGEVCTCADVPRIAALLQRLHHCGWVHRDPHVQNFLQHGERLFLIDCARARPWPWRYAQMMDVVLLNNCCPGSLGVYGVSASAPLYRFAKMHNNLLKWWRRLKRRFRPWAYRQRA